MLLLSLTCLKLGLVCPEFQLVIGELLCRPLLLGFLIGSVASNCLRIPVLRRTFSLNAQHGPLPWTGSNFLVTSPLGVAGALLNKLIGEHLCRPLLIGSAELKCLRIPVLGRTFSLNVQLGPLPRTGSNFLTSSSIAMAGAL